MPLSVLSAIAIILGLLLLIWSADRFVDGAADLARYLGVPPILVGMLIIGFGTSAPEMLVSGVAAWNGNPDMGIGNAIGSNITNIALVLGVTALFYALPVQSRIVRQELPILLAAGVGALVLLSYNNFSAFDGLILLVGLTVVLAWFIYLAFHEPSDDLFEDLEETYPDTPHKRTAMFWTVAGLLVLLASSHLLVWGATNIAKMLHVSDLMIGLTVVAIGTSLPELAATIISAKKGETDLAIGNIVGSNIFNTLGVLALPPLLSASSPITVDSNAIYRDMPIMLILTLLLWVFAKGCWQKHMIGWWKGAVFFACFIGYEAILFYHASNNITCTSFLCL